MIQRFQPTYCPEKKTNPGPRARAPRCTHKLMYKALAHMAPGSTRLTFRNSNSRTITLRCVQCAGGTRSTSGVFGTNKRRSTQVSTQVEKNAQQLSKKGKCQKKVQGNACWELRAMAHQHGTVPIFGTISHVVPPYCDYIGFHRLLAAGVPFFGNTRNDGEDICSRLRPAQSASPHLLDGCGWLFPFGTMSSGPNIAMVGPLRLVSSRPNLVKHASVKPAHNQQRETPIARLPLLRATS